jgi:dephospho-CoA kinase
MFVIGLSGGVASGKSLVANCFQHFGAEILDADRMGHDVLREAEVLSAVSSVWGDAVIENGEINRSALGRIVFDPVNGLGQLRQLEQITHPRIGKMIRSRLEQLRRDTKLPAVVLDAPVMFKAGWDKQCDKIVFVEAKKQIRLQRARQRGWSDDELVRRESRQIPIDEKRSRATDFIDNSGTREDTFIQARELWKKWELHLPINLVSPASFLST